MNNMEWLKNINSVLSQVIELTDNNPFFGKWLDMADKAAKQVANSLMVPYGAPFTRDNPENEPSHNRASAENNNSGNNAAINPLKLLEMVNKGIKQFSVLEPFLKDFLKAAPGDGESSKSTSSGSQSNNSRRPFVNRAFMNPLFGMLLPVLLAFVFILFR